MDKDRTYSLDEILEKTDYDRRTIAYYVQEGLLPKVGRRGPKTRYPRQYLDRLLFIKMTRELQDRGLMETTTLGETKELLDRLPESLIHDIVTGEAPLEVIAGGVERSEARFSVASPRARAKLASRGRLGFFRKRETRGSELDDALGLPSAPEEEPLQAIPRATGELQIEQRLFKDGGVDESMSVRPGQEPSLPVDQELRRTLLRLLHVLREGGSERHAPIERRTRARVMPGLYLSAKGLDQEGEHLLQKAAHLLRKLTLEDDGDL